MHSFCFCIKTFDRPECLRRLVYSIRKYYNEKILIANDGSQPVDLVNDFDDVEVIDLQYDVGISAGRNALIQSVTVDYFVLLDDDFVVHDGTNIDSMIGLLVENDLDIVGGIFSGTTDNYDDVYIDSRAILHVVKPAAPEGYDLRVCTRVINFFVASTQKVRSIGGWDDDLKLDEHTEFFLRCRKHNLKVGSTSRSSVKHVRGGSEEYWRMRDRTEFSDLFEQKYGIRGFELVTEEH